VQQGPDVSCGVWQRAEKYHTEIEAARKRFAEHIERAAPVREEKPSPHGVMKAQ